MPKPTIKAHFWVVISLALAMKLVAGMFKIDTFIDHPQFDYPHSLEAFQRIVEMIKAGSSIPWYRIFFILDYIWAPLTILLIIRTVKSLFWHPHTTQWPGLLIVTGAVALAFDFTENWLYLEGQQNFHKVQQAKILAYALFLCIFLYHTSRYFFGENETGGARQRAAQQATKRFLKNLLLTLRCSIPSLVTIAIVFGLLTQMGQGGSIIVDLLDRPWNLTAFLLTGLFMGVTLSHYPSYLLAKRDTDQSSIVWCMHSFIIPSTWTGFGLITCKDTKADDCSPQTNQTPSGHIQKLIRYSLGVIFLSSLLYIFLYVGEEYLGWPLPPALAWLIGALDIWLLTKVYVLFEAGGIKKLMKIFWGSLGFSSLSILASAILSWRLGWSHATLAVTVVALASLMVFYVVFRLARPYTRLKLQFTFLLWLTFTGWTTLISLVISNIALDFTVSHINPLLTLLLYLSNFYGLTIIIVKHIEFYKDKQSCRDSGIIRRRFQWLRYALPITSMIVAILIVSSCHRDNELHRLRLYQEQDSTILSTKTFAESLLHVPSSQRHVQVASYGGGLKANLWTLLALNKLQEQTNGQFLKSTLTMSGTSGGVIGLGNYAPLWANALTPEGQIPQQAYENIYNKIRQIGEFNHLGIDMTYLLGWDLVREVLPIGDDGKDRSYMAMTYYRQMTETSKLTLENTPTFRQTWKAIYKRSGYYPALIVNTYATHGLQGNAFSCKLPEDGFSYAFPGAINILDYDSDPYTGKKSIGYFEALSCSNRFPIFSPTARIRGKGHFLDGGYFDNSGLSSSLGMNAYLSRQMAIDSSNTRYVIINGDKNAYIRAAFSQFLGFNHPRQIPILEKQIGELPAIAIGIANLDKVPNYFEGTLYAPMHILMPQIVTYQDLVKAFGGLPRVCPKQISAFLKENKEQIRDALRQHSAEYNLDQWGIVRPALARLNSKPGVRYQEAMMHYHPIVAKQLEQIKNWVNGEVPSHPQAGKGAHQDALCHW